MLRSVARVTRRPLAGAAFGRQLRWDSDSTSEEKLAAHGSGVWNILLDPKTAYTNDLRFEDGKERPPKSLFRVCGIDGEVVNSEWDPNLTEEVSRKMMTSMITMQTMDSLGVEAQRQGTISFYMTQHGEEGAIVGSAEGLEPQDMIFAQYREAGALIHRGYPIESMLAQCMGSEQDKGKGRQMPVHYGSPEFNYQTISSPLGTQIPQAAGAGYSYRLEGNNRIACCYFGDGAASEGDFHAALNFASTLRSNTLFFCRNNGFAISTPAKEQYAGDGIYHRGVAYGIPSLRVDGNDIVAVYAAVTQARKLIIKKGTPVLIEAMTYRGGHHSTSDDSSKYRNKNERDMWLKSYSPITRFGNLLKSKGWWSDEDTAAVAKEAHKTTVSALRSQEALPKFPATALFDGVFQDMPPHLKEQQKDLERHLSKHHQHYPSYEGVSG